MNWAGTGIHHRWSFPIVQKPVAWPHLSKREARGCSLAVWGVRALVCWRASEPQPQLEQGILSSILVSPFNSFLPPAERIKWDTVY